jgi:hypothetical protein
MDSRTAITMLTSAAAIQQQLGVERRVAHYMCRIGADQQESHADREQKTEERQR